LGVFYPPQSISLRTLRCVRGIPLVGSINSCFYLIMPTVIRRSCSHCFSFILTLKSAFFLLEASPELSLALVRSPFYLSDSFLLSTGSYHVKGRLFPTVTAIHFEHPTFFPPFPPCLPPLVSLFSFPLPFSLHESPCVFDS